MNLEKPDNSKQKVAAGLVALIVIALLAGGVMVYGVNQDKQNTVATTTGTSNLTSQTSASTSTAPASSTSSSTSSSSSSYKDGTYSATSDYYVPHGSESIKVTLTISNGTITNSSIQNSEYDGESAQYQEAFAGEYKSYVVGKPISSLQLNYVAGASDTTQGFDDALQQIKTKAQA